MPSSAPEIIPMSRADRHSLRWTDRFVSSGPLQIPPAVSVEGKNYLIADFDSQGSYALLLENTGFAEALCLSAELYGAETLRLSEWASLYRTAGKHGVDTDKLPVPAQTLKNPEQFRAVIAAAAGWPEALKNYLDTKQVPWRTLYILSLSDAAYTSGFAKTNPSVQSFRQFVETQRDFQLKGLYSAEHFRANTERRTPVHIKTDALLAELNAGLAPVTAQNRDNFETPRLHFSFFIDSSEDFRRILKKLRNSQDKMDEFYAFMKENGLL